MIGILDYGMGNISSVNNSLTYLGFDTKIIQESIELNDNITHLIVPGVGSYSKAMQNLKNRGFDELIYEFINSGRPYLGICLGMQLLSSLGYEDGETKGLDLIKGEVVPFDISLHVPHVGWNNLECKKSHEVMGKYANHIDFYFVHSYHFKPYDENDILTTTDYEIEFCSSVSKNNILGVQFHPEKSQEPGLSLLEYFCEWDGKC
ncbi:imidazole glycerol phosphate synthase subunit HisH [Aliarcobacter butzleri]|uniref:imidazole glycerol phosphate synthase subunit HisH n=1 Tax=Aliarcobacter butzleri TaxID=28197 RepID=UPI0002295C3D|nr:imidazole glycerol phosphate synthase subunit HisH [Aliarcobacter butzleri]QDM00883.1 imidazole glycerol phosphate synthase subunit HisH [Aliarcobacter butzleri]UWY60827.1 imidazole glycerol phosphate synthase subunit HisH [Aliarcobacter butzleri]BAK70343.1 imidazole glycerol phosphate synthase glutamine amidotransferase subunit [Aliarcobacter butzleri ED-1]